MLQFTHEVTVFKWSIGPFHGSWNQFIQPWQLLNKIWTTMDLSAKYWVHYRFKDKPRFIKLLFFFKHTYAHDLIINVFLTMSLSPRKYLIHIFPKLQNYSYLCFAKKYLYIKSNDTLWLHLLTCKTLWFVLGPPILIDHNIWRSMLTAFSSLYALHMV